MSEEGGRARIRVWVILLLFGLVGVAVGLAGGRKEKVIPIGSPCQFDDFTFTVVGMRSAPSTKPGSVKCIVSLKVSNLAKRVTYTLDRRSVLFVTREGLAYGPLPVAPGVTDPCAGPLAPGTSCVSELVYKVAAGTLAPRLRISFGAIGDTLEAIIFGRKSLELR